ncbi:ATP-binding protein [Timonella senegalensis]|uniref:ATP-binding protein n=1 Tax=Timonella senegalensis TaxID=1465825 RepID=UPI0028AE903C|nr:ATP-binding protein [Timonella senegalensis]
MRRRLILATISAVAVAVLLLGFPLAFFGGFYVFSNERQELANRTDALARAVEYRITRNEPLDQDQLDRYAFGGQQPDAQVRVILPTGENGTAGETIDGKKLESAVFTNSKALVTISISYWDVFMRSFQVVSLVISAAFVAFGAGIWVAVWQANRLSAPLVYLAASAEQLGSGQVRPHVEKSGVEEIDLVADELTRSADRLAVRIAAERQFASDASHQLRTPLTALSMRLEEISMLADDSLEIQEEARISLEQVERLVATVDDLLSRSRKAQGGTTEPVHLEEVLQQQEEEWRPIFAKAGRELSMVREGDFMVLATPGALAQVLATLIENSLKHGAGTTTVVAKQKGPRGGIVVQVSDEGEGVPDELVPKIFERGVTSGAGTGLGLPLAKDLAATDGARLELSVPRPAQFTLHLSGVPRKLDATNILPHGNMVSSDNRGTRKLKKLSSRGSGNSPT